MLTNEPNDEIASDERIKSKYSQICEQLNIDQTIVNTTWDKYQAIRNDHTLEVSTQITYTANTRSVFDSCPIHFDSIEMRISFMANEAQSPLLTVAHHPNILYANNSLSFCFVAWLSSLTQNGQIQWLCCALYVSLTSKSNELSEISLTKLLRLCNIKIYEFLKKTEQWISMVSSTSSDSSRDKFKQLKQSLSVSILAYEKYSLIYREYFTSPTYAEDAAMAAASITTPQKNSKKLKATNKCTSNNLYEFCWYLFILARGSNPEYTLDLVTSFHVLLCCIDSIFANVVADKRDDLINPSFSQSASVLLNKERTGKNSSDAEPVSIMKDLCTKQNASELETLAIKSHNWKNLMQKYIRDGVLKGNSTTLLGFLSTANYDHNIKSLKQEYEAYIQRGGKLDEGIFLLQAPSDNHTDPKTHSQILKSYVPETPLTCRNRLPDMHEMIISPVSNASRNVNRLNHHLGKFTDEPNKSLKDLFSACGVDPFAEMEAQLETMRDKFLNAFRTNSASDRFKLAKKLYFNLLEKIIKKERSQKQNFDPKVSDAPIHNCNLRFYF